MIYNGPERFEVVNNILRTNHTLRLNAGVEVGVRNAETSEFLLQNNEELVMFLVDPYGAYLDLGYQFSTEEQSIIKKAAATRLKKYGDRACWIYKTSLEGAKLVDHGDLDFVFIDGNHDAPHVENDIYAWYPKVRAGGLLMGHDYSMAAVKAAVNAWATKFGKTIIASDSHSDVWAIEI